MASKYRVYSDEWPGLIKVAEECSEAAQAALKIMGGRNTPEQIAHLEDEIGDVYAALAFLSDHNDLDFVRIAERVQEKHEAWTARRDRKRGALNER